MATTPAGNRALTETRSVVLPGCVLVGGVIVLVWFGLLPAALVLAPNVFWEQVPARNAQVAIAPVHGNWISMASYDYELGGRRYSGDRYSFISPEEYMSEEDLRSIQGGAERYQSCFVSRWDSSQSVLQAMVPVRALAKPFAIAALATLAAIWGYRRVRAGRKIS
jgi:hypothetical protein